jgi:iron complex transport system permease protein
MVFLFLVNISFGSVSIPLNEVVNGLFLKEMSKESWEIILWNFRFPKAITAILVNIKFCCYVHVFGSRKFTVRYVP